MMGFVVILDLLAPLFVLIALGALLHRLGLMPGDVVAGLNRILYWVGLPVAVFHSLAVAERTAGAMGPLLFVLLGGTLVSVAVAAGLSWVAHVPAIGRGTFVQGAFRGNLTFIGLPLILTVPGVPQAPAVLAMAPMLVVYNSISVAALLLSRHQTGWAMVRPVAVGIARNPIILASLAGAGWHYAGWPLPVAAQRTLGSVGQMALPLALLCIGAGLMTVRIRGNRRVASLAALHKVVLSPLIGYAIGRCVGLPAGEMLAALLFMTCPTAAVSYTMVKEIGGDEALAASVIVLSSVLAAPALAVVLAAFGV